MTLQHHHGEQLNPSQMTNVMHFGNRLEYLAEVVLHLKLEPKLTTLAPGGVSGDRPAPQSSQLPSPLKGNDVHLRSVRATYDHDCPGEKTGFTMMIYNHLLTIS